MLFFYLRSNFFTKAPEFLKCRRHIWQQKTKARRKICSKNRRPVRICAGTLKCLCCALHRSCIPLVGSEQTRVGFGVRAMADCARWGLLKSWLSWRDLWWSHTMQWLYVMYSTVEQTVPCADKSLEDYLSFNLTNFAVAESSSDHERQFYFGYVGTRYITTVHYVFFHLRISGFFLWRMCA